MFARVQKSPHPFDVVVVAASLGGIHTLRTVLGSLPSDFPAPIVIVQHLSDRWPSRLVEALDPCCSLPVTSARCDLRLTPPGVFVAPPGQHLQIRRGGVTELSQTPRVNLVRPSADVLFTSAADCYGDRTLALVLTGKGRDGAAGAAAVKRAGGCVIVQNAQSSAAFSMPSSTIMERCVDFVLPLEVIAPALISLVMVPGAASLLRVRHDASEAQPHWVRAVDWEASLAAQGNRWVWAG
jgi:two-component system chemotaxis response regulator CheB